MMKKRMKTERERQMKRKKVLAGVERGKVGCASLAQLMDVHFSWPKLFQALAQSRVRLAS